MSRVIPADRHWKISASIQPDFAGFGKVSFDIEFDCLVHYESNLWNPASENDVIGSVTCSLISLDINPVGTLPSSGGGFWNAAALHWGRISRTTSPKNFSPATGESRQEVLDQIYAPPQWVLDSTNTVQYIHLDNGLTGDSKQKAINGTVFYRWLGGFQFKDDDPSTFSTNYMTNPLPFTTSIHASDFDYMNEKLNDIQIATIVTRFYRQTDPAELDENQQVVTPSKGLAISAIKADIFLKTEGGFSNEYRYYPMAVKVEGSWESCNRYWAAHPGVQDAQIFSQTEAFLRRKNSSWVATDSQVINNDKGNQYPQLGFYKTGGTWKRIPITGNHG